ncbi:hypothetical protein ACFPL7_09090 [Dongia soli]|uniref:Uncharacterized protein n=1 Tax=Dongia soli TaxID=600628 RepID=A0ABU5EA76_9PROT|nr:hypothetical protein [Dongia soli]MDY0883103.1 hypothetical protein [Dongia soli]
MAMQLGQEGLSFSDEGGGFTLKAVSGRGTLSDPFVVVEEVTQQQAVLVIRGFTEVGNRIGTDHTAGVAVTKVVINRTADVWQSFQLELRQIEGQHSPYEDGLSFAQNTAITNAFTTSSFPNIQRFDEPEDRLVFSGKSVRPGESAKFTFLITDMSPISKFFLVQQPLRPVSGLPATFQGAQAATVQRRISQISYRWRQKHQP